MPIPTALAGYGVTLPYSNVAANLGTFTGKQLGDLLIYNFVMNGTPSLPAGWTLAQLYGNYQATMWARVDDVNVMAADGQQFTIGDGGSAVYYTWGAMLIRGAKRIGDPIGQIGASANSGTVGPAMALPVAGYVDLIVDDTLIVHAEGTAWSGDQTVTHNYLTNWTPYAAGHHMAAGPSPGGRAGTNWQQFTYPVVVNAYGALMAILPELTEDPIVGGAKKRTEAHSVIVGGVKKTITHLAPIVGGVKKEEV